MKQMASVYDGWVSKHLNRHLSRPMARGLARTPATPNQVSVAALLIAIGSMAAYIAGFGYLGGIFAQFSSVVDGVDGDLARLNGMTSAFGGFFDSVLDRYADAVILLGLTYWAAGPDAVRVWAVGFAALAGTFAVTYTRARIEPTQRNLFDKGIASAASRDVRLLLIMVGSIAGLGFPTLVAIAILTNAVVILRLFRARATLAGPSS